MLLGKSLLWWMGYSGLLSLLVMVPGSVAVLLCRQPARRLRIIELTLVGCLVAPLLGLIPGYPQLGIAWPHGEPAPRQAISTPPPSPTEPADVAVVSQPDVGPQIQPLAAEPTSPATIEARSTETPIRHATETPTCNRAETPTCNRADAPARDWHVDSWLVGLYLLGLAVGVVWWLVGIASLARIVWTSNAAQPRWRRLLTEIAGPRGDQVRLLTSRLIKQPFASAAALVPWPRRNSTPRRAVIVLPDNLRDDEQAVRWALAHEWSHIERGDFRAWSLAAVARVVFFYHPLVWWLRRQLRLCQDYMADAQASRQASQPEDYAEFLVARAAMGSLDPAMAGLGMGFHRGKSELYRRVVMLVENRPLENRPPRLWTVSVTCAALLLAGLAATFSVAKDDEAVGRSLSEAVAEFNQKAANDKIGAKEPRLTEEEVISAIRGWDRTQDPVADETYAVFQRIADTKRLPAGATLDFTTRWAGYRGYEFTVWWVNLNVKTGKNTGYTFRVRDRKISVGATGSAGHAPANKTNANRARSEKPAKAKITLKSLGFVTGVYSSGPSNDEETEKLIQQKKYKLVKTFDSPDGQKQYAYRFTYPDGRQVNRNFSMPLDDVSSWADYEKKQKLQRQQRDERISQALTAGRFRLLDLEVMQVHLCRDVDSGKKFKVQRIAIPNGKEIAFPRADYGPLPDSVKQTSWKDHLKAIRDGRCELLELETGNSYTYEMTADDGTKLIFSYGGDRPLEIVIKRASEGGSDQKTAGKKDAKTGRGVYVWSGNSGNKETVYGVRPKGDCSISGTVVDEDGKPIKGARMYLHYSVTHGSIFVNTDKKGKFEIENLPTGPFSLIMSRTPGYQDVPYDPKDKGGIFPQFSLGKGEHRSGIVLTAKAACRITGKIVGPDGKVPKDIDTYIVTAWNENGGCTHKQSRIANRADGSYEIDGLGDGPVYVMAINQPAAKKGTAWPPIYYPSAFSRADAKLITFDKSRHVDGVDITLKKKGGIVLEGTVLDEEGHPVPEAFVVANHQEMFFDYNTTYTDAQGHYRIEGMGPGVVLVHVDAVHRGWVRTRKLITLDEGTTKSKCNFTLHRGVTISGKFVDEKGRDWRIGDSYAYASNVSEDRPARTQFELDEGDYSSTAFQNKHRPESVGESLPGTFLLGEGDYDCDQAIFPTTSTFLIQGMMPGQTLVGLSPNKEGQKVVKVLYQGQDIMTSGIDTKPGEEVKDVTIVIGTE